MKDLDWTYILGVIALLIVGAGCIAGGWVVTGKCLCGIAILAICVPLSIVVVANAIRALNRPPR